jgi:hypothetical protein
MNTLAQLEDAIRQLSDVDRTAFRAWYAEFDAQEWDRQLAADVAASKLDWLSRKPARQPGGALHEPINHSIASATP